MKIKKNGVLMTRLQVVYLAELIMNSSGLSMRKTASKMGIPSSTLSSWIKRKNEWES